MSETKECYRISNNSDNSIKHENSSSDSDSDTEGLLETVVTSSTSSNDASDDDGSPDNFRKRKSATFSSGIVKTFTLVQLEAISLKMKKFYKRIECVERNSDGAIKTMLGQMRKETSGKKNKATPTCAASTETPRFLRTTAIEPLRSCYPQTSIRSSFIHHN